MRVASVDTGFVRAPPDRVFEVLVRPDAYPSWWPGTAGRGSVLDLRGIGRVRWVTGGIVSGVEVTILLEGRGLRGRLQWYLEPFKEGTVVYGIVDLETRRPFGARRRRTVRAGVHAALFALKARLE